MGEITIYECDVTGERYGSLNAGKGVLDFEIRRKHKSPFEVNKRDVYISIRKIESAVGYQWPSRIEYIAVEEGEIVGISMGYGSDSDVYQYIERDSVLVDQYGPFFKFVENEVLY